MKKGRSYSVASVILFAFCLFLGRQAFSDDTCVFMITADDVPPNIVILLDNGAEMEQIAWHENYVTRGHLVLQDISGTFQDNEILRGSSSGIATVNGTLSGSVLDYDEKTSNFALGDTVTGQTSGATATVVSDSDYTPNGDGVDNDHDGRIDEADEEDVVLNGGSGRGFFVENGYGIVGHGSTYYLVPVLDNLELGSYTIGLAGTSSGHTWTLNGKTATLPANPYTTAVDGVIDNAAHFRYSKNYLNWIFYSGRYTGDGSDLPDKSRFYYAKKAIMSVATLTANRAKFGIYNFTSNHSGASNVQPLGMVVNTPLATLPENNTLQSNFINNVNNMGTVTYSPLAEGLASIGGYYASSSSHVVGEYCQKSMAIVVTPGVSSYDNSAASGSSPGTLADYDGDDGTGGIGEGYVKLDSTTYEIPKNVSGSTYLDDVAHYLYTHDVVGYEEGYQNVYTYTIGFMGDRIGNLFLINTSNNGNGNLNLYESSDPEYGKYHYVAERPDGLSAALMEAVNDIISRTSSFTAPVVPVVRTTSGSSIYMAFFKPVEGNFWEGNVTRFGLSENLQIVDANGDPATWPNGAIKQDAVPYWATKNWADSNKSNYIHNSMRKIYTYLGETNDLTDSRNAFKTSNGNVTAALLGSPTHTTQEIIDYIRGADVFDSDGDGNTSENRAVMTADVLHSEPLVVQHDQTTTVVYFGSNDGMLHAVSASDGSEMWAFIPPDQLSRLKGIVEGVGHQYFLDSSPKAFDQDGDGVVESGEQVVLVCGERSGGTAYFALDITDPQNPDFLWRINRSDDSVTSGGSLPSGAAPDTVIPELGETWAEPRFGKVKTSAEDTTGTHVFFVGGGFSSTNSSGKAVLAINVVTGDVVKKFSGVIGMNYAFPSSVSLVDCNDDGFVDKIYVGDLGSQVWRFGSFVEPSGTPLAFPASDQNINSWTAQILFTADTAHTRMFFYPPSVVLERGYDLIFIGSGDRNDACSDSGSDRIYCVKDIHASTTLEEADLVDMTESTATAPNLDSNTGDVDGNGRVDRGWFIRLASGEKYLAESVVFNKALYATTFTPNDDPCLPGGFGKLYALHYKTAEAVTNFGEGGELKWSVEIGGGIPSKPVTVITEKEDKFLISVGSTTPDENSEEVSAGIVAMDPVSPDANFFYLWWEDF